MDEPRMGTYRHSMRTNVLLAKSELGKVKPSTFANKNDDRIFGIPNIRDPEGARDVSMIWKEHQPNPDDKPGPDFTKMNKTAAMNGLTKSKEQHMHRVQHYAYLKKGEAVRQPPPKLPSDTNVEHTYGTSSTHIPLEVYRVTGDPANMKNLIQNSYADEWISMNRSRRSAGPEAGGSGKRGIPLTRACEGHAYGAYTKYISPPPAKEPFKMSRFKSVSGKLKTQGG
uniref:Flagellar associated protein n=1 Tax=Tetraselmis sp. GSL018 TaxID=582737 RepID=A0A061R1H1_9CHLO|mmetsp:Transcript_31491/g.74841  ORF Transcript_31491/g.74841 Transcript_31491/m.74841 type:complete len:226 (+) Transcript_31491:285-962(+)